MNQTCWKWAFNRKEFDGRLENAYRRVAGSIGFTLSQDRGNTGLLKDTAKQAFDSGMDTGGSMLFKLGRGALEMGSFRAKGDVSLEDVSAEILLEFFNEGNAAYQVVKAGLYADALAFAKGQGIADEYCISLLRTADDCFIAPSKDAFTQEAVPLIQAGIASFPLALLTGGIVFAALVAAIRAPIPAIGGGAIAAGCMYYYLRTRMQARAESLLHLLPTRLYALLVAGINANISRYEDVVNKGLETLPKSKGSSD